jgi:hypothetical protein
LPRLWRWVPRWRSRKHDFEWSRLLHRQRAPVVYVWRADVTARQKKSSVTRAGLLTHVWVEAPSARSLWHGFV